LGRRGAAGAPIVFERRGVRLDTVRRLAERDGRLLRLTAKELAVLEALLAADGGLVSTAELIDIVWDGEVDSSSSVPKVTIHQLRRKLGNPPLIETSQGLGYRI
jgi:DNA-binding response OmpR family regulator